MGAASLEPGIRLLPSPNLSRGESVAPACDAVLSLSLPTVHHITVIKNRSRRKGGEGATTRNTAIDLRSVRPARKKRKEGKKREEIEKKRSNPCGAALQGVALDNTLRARQRDESHWPARPLINPPPHQPHEFTTVARNPRAHGYPAVSRRPFGKEKNRGWVDDSVGCWRRESAVEADDVSCPPSWKERLVAVVVTSLKERRERVSTSSWSVAADSRVSLPPRIVLANSWSEMIMYTVAEDHMGDNEIAQVFVFPWGKRLLLFLMLWFLDGGSFNDDSVDVALLHSPSSLCRWSPSYAGS